ncbi:MAG: diguanylate cyclase [Proteobacteria bacterium]|nr:diguanylate cyclase [Pseudomonadota bacterium]
MSVPGRGTEDWERPMDGGRTAPGQSESLTEILACVSREALQGEGLHEIMQNIVDCLVRKLPVAIASILLLDHAGTHFTHEVYAGDLYLQQPVGLPWPVSIGAAGRCVRTGVAQLIADVDDDPDYVAGNAAVRAEYLVPIRHRERFLGVLNIESTRTDFLTAETCAAFDAIADQVAGAIHLARIAAELESANRRLQELSMRDGLTGIANRRCFDERLATSWALLARESGVLALALVDADHFKDLNDACGHLYGDECLRELARICTQAAVRESDLAARYGGEELVVLLPGCELEDALRIGEGLRARVEALAMRHPRSAIAGHLTVSVGVSAVRPVAALRPEALIAAADNALYAAKAAGRNRVAGCAVAGAPSLAA